MGRKKNKKQQQQHVQQSMGQMISKAALAQMGPQIEKYINETIQRLGSRLAMQTAETTETLFSRIIVLENIIIEKLGYTKDDLANLVSDLEDSSEGLALVTDGVIQKGDVVRLEVKTKTKDQAEYQGSSRLKLYDTGTGNTLGEELESALIGLKSGEIKTINFGKDKEMVAEFTINRVSRAKAQETKTENTTSEAQGENQSQGQ